MNTYVQLAQIIIHITETCTGDLKSNLFQLGNNIIYASLMLH